MAGENFPISMRVGRLPSLYVARWEGREMGALGRIWRVGRKVRQWKVGEDVQWWERGCW